MLTVTPDALAYAACSARRIGDTLTAAQARAVTPTTVIPPAGTDDVSRAISVAFERFGAEFHHATATAGEFGDQFGSTMARAAATYQSGEHANAASFAISEFTPMVMFGVLAIFGPLLEIPILWPVVVPMVVILLGATLLAGVVETVLGN